MPTPKVYTLGDPCPACNGTLRKAIQPTERERYHAHPDRKESMIPLPPHYDTAPLETVDDLGELWRCTECGYPHREKPAAAAGKKRTTADD